MGTTGKIFSLMKEHSFQISSQFFVHSGSWLSLLLLSKSAPCIRERWSTALSLVIWGRDDAMVPLHMLGPRGTWKTVQSVSPFISSWYHLSCAFTHRIFLECLLWVIHHRKFCQLSKLAMRMSQLSIPPLFSISTDRTYE